MSKAAELAKWGEVSTNGQVSGRRNMVINGAMNVAQRSASVTGLGATSGYYTLDRWYLALGNTAGRFTMTQTADGPVGFANCMKLDCTTADTSIAAGELLVLQQHIEGQDVQAIGKGVTGAKQITLSFYVKANAAFTFNAEIQDQDNGRTNGKAFATTTDWVRHEITFEADADDGSSPFDDDNANSLSVNFWLHGGSTYTGGTLASGWENRTDANRAVGIDSFYSSTDNNFFITGLQLEVGSVATPFEHRSFGEELALCQRYFCHNEFNGGSLNVYQSELAYGQINHPVAMRAVPTITFQTTFTNFGIHYYGGNNTSGSSYQANATGTAKAMSFSHALSSGTHPSTRHSAHGYFDYLADAEL
jgi:hypothetical protein